MLYIHICLSRSSLLQCFMPFVGLCLAVFGATCLRGCIHPFLWFVGCNHLWDMSPWCWCAWYTPFSTLCDVVILALLALCHSFGFLCFCASLHTCLHVHAWVCASFVLQSHWTMDTRSKPTFVLLRHPFCLTTCLFAPVWHLLLACILACFPSICFFACLLACFFCHCMYMQEAWTFGARVWPPRHKQNMARMRARRRKPTKRQCSVD